MPTLQTLFFVLFTAVAGLACSTAPDARPATSEGESDDEEARVATQAVALDRSLLPAPVAALTADEIARFTPLPAAPPVFSFHQICPDTCLPTDTYGMSRIEFERTMRMLKAAGYTSISPAQYLRYLRSDWVGLPQKPVLITFDDGLLDAYRGADAILQATGMRATMFVITNRPDANAAFMSWAEILAAHESGRWDIQLHAHAGHTLVPITLDGVLVSKPTYAYKLDGETYEQWRARMQGDILTGIARLTARVPGYQPLLFAVPNGQYGQLGSNDARIENEMSTFLTQRFGAWFGAAPLDFTVLGGMKDRQRLAIRNTHTATALYDWLRNQTVRRARSPALGPTPALCAKNQAVTSHACVVCAPGSTRPAGDLVAGPNTSCTPTLCATDQSVSGHACVACAPGTRRPSGDLATGNDTSCATVGCAADHSVRNHVCTPCAPGTERAPGDLMAGNDTSCAPTLCAGNHAVVNHACVPCAAGTDRWAGDLATGSDTSCTATSDATRFDVVVVGAGTGGIAAAIQAARLGRTVALIEETDTIGGQMVAAAVSTMDSGRTGVDSGIYREAVERMTQIYKASGKRVGTCGWSQKNLCFEPRVARQVFASMLAEHPTITLLKRTRVSQVRRAGDTVTGVMAEQRGGPARELGAAIVIDATEWGDLLPLAGVAYRVGNVAGPSSSASTCVQENTYVAVLRKYPAGVPAALAFTGPPAGYTPALRNAFAKVLSPLKECPSAAPGATPACYDWTQGGAKLSPVNWRTYVGYRGLPDSSNPVVYDVARPDLITLTGLNWANDVAFSVADVESPAARRTRVCEAKLRTVQLLYFIQSEVDAAWSVTTDQQLDSAYDPAEECENIAPELRAITRHFPPIPYVREGRRLVGVETLTGADIYRSGTPAVARRRFVNALAVGDYGADIHGCRADRMLESPETMSDIPSGSGAGPFQVPMGVFIPATVDGFLVAEKNLSVTRVANGATRLQPITMMTGQAVGAMAALSIARGITPRTLAAIEVQDILARAGLRLAQEGTADVLTPEGWAAAQLAAVHEIMPGYPDGTFRPSLPVSSAEAAVILAKAFEAAGKPAEEADPLAAPEPATTRGELAVIVARILVTGTR